MIIGLPVWTAALDIANSSLAKKVPYSIAFASEHMATDPISIVNQVGNISSISIHDPSDAEAELRDAEAELRDAEAELRDAEAELRDAEEQVHPLRARMAGKDESKLERRACAGNGVAASKEEPPAEDATADERARRCRERMADKAKLERQANELERLRDENQNLRNLQQIVADGLGRVTPDAAPTTGDVAPEGYALVAVGLSNEGLSGFLEIFRENEIDDDALAHVSVEDLVEVGVPAGAARRILSK